MHPKFCYLILLEMFLIDFGDCQISRVTLNNKGEYFNLRIGIAEEVPQDANLIDYIKRKLTAASAVLEEATRTENRAGLVFKSITILVPENWINSGQYNASSGENYESADIRIDYSQSTEDYPITKKKGRCYRPGLHIRLTNLHFVEDDKFPWSLEKKIVENWAQYRWGVFPEYPTQNINTKFYVRDGQFQAVKCGHSIQGTITNSVNGGQCQRNELTNLAQKDCTFYPKSSSMKSASLLYTSALFNVNRFCDSKSKDPNVLHNSYAPNEQNELCYDLSVWDVMRRHDDFKKNLSPRTTTTAPNFKLVQKGSRNVALVVDSSGSMAGDKIQALIKAARFYIRDLLEPKAKLGMLHFASNVTILESLKQIDSNTVKENYVKKINSLSASGSTCLGDGLATGFELLGGDMQRPESYSGDGYILLITDGEANSHTRYSFDKAIQIVTRSQVTVDCISIGDDTDERLKDLCERTGGKYLKGNSFMELIEAMKENLVGRVKKEDKIHTIASGDIKTGQKKIIPIDSTSGRKSKVLVKFSKPNQQVSLQSPSGTIYDHRSGSAIYRLSLDKMSVTIYIPESAETGDWILTLMSKNRRKRNAVYSDGKYVVITQDRDNATYVYSMSGGVDCNFIHNVSLTSRCFCHVVITNNSQPVVKAKLTLILTSPKSRRIEVVMMDNGAGSDIIMNDGVYTASIIASDFQEAGIYDTKATVQINTTVDDSVIQRVLTLGSVKISTPNVMNNTDGFPPDRIRNLLVEVVDKSKHVVRAIFIAVGDNGDRITTASYQFKLDETLLNDSSIPSPNSPGTEEKILLQLSIPPNKNKEETFQLFVRAVDAVGNKGHWSRGFSLTFSTPDFNATNVGKIVNNSYSLLGHMECDVIDQPVRTSRCLVLVTARWKETNAPLLHANVSMTVSRPDSSEVSVSMFDNGSGSDKSESDGIYSASIIGQDLNNKGAYAVRSTVGSTLKSGIYVQESIPVGSLICKNKSFLLQVDDFIPDTIRIISHSWKGRFVNLKFYAVGDDGDRNRAKHYEIQLNNNHLPLSISHTPGEPGSTESILILPSLNSTSTTSSSWTTMSIRAVDNENNPGKWSLPISIAQESMKEQNKQIIDNLLFWGLLIFLPAAVIVAIAGILIRNIYKLSSANGNSIQEEISLDTEWESINTCDPIDYTSTVFPKF